MAFPCMPVLPDGHSARYTKSRAHLELALDIVDGLHALHDSNALSCKTGLLRAHRCCLEKHDPAVGWHTVARVQRNNVAGEEFTRRKGAHLRGKIPQGLTLQAL
jgi:hypothetical protein